MLPTDRWLRYLLVPALVFIATAMDRNYQTDLWHHLARGRVLMEEGRLLDEDRFTCTIPGRAFQDCNWGCQAANYGLYRLGGLPLVQTANASTLALTMALLVALCRRRSGSLLAAAGVGLLVFFGLWQMLIIRPQTFSLLLFVLLYASLEGALRRPGLLFVSPLILAVWTNVHGGFPVGLALVGCYFLALALGTRRVRDTLPWACCLAGCLAATLVNPYGWRVCEYVLLTSRTASGRRIDEWLPPGLDLLAGKVWVLSVLLLLGLLAWTGRRSGDRVRTWRDVILMACFLPPACGSVRMVAWWLLVSAPLLAERLADLWPLLRQQEDDKPTVGAAVALAGLVAAVVLSLPWLERFNPVLARPGRAHRVEADLQAVSDRLAAEAPGCRVFTRFAWGEYLGWSLAGRGTVFLDGRIEIFPDLVWEQYNAVARGQAGWEGVLDGYGVDVLLLDASGYHRGLLPLVERSPAWQEVLHQGDGVLFVRAGSGHALRGSPRLAGAAPLPEAPLAPR